MSELLITLFSIVHVRMNIPVLLACVLTPVVAALVINLVIFALGWNQRNGSQRSLLPPGWAIGLIWIIVLAALGGALYAVWPISVAGAIVIAAIGYCLAYPFATGGLEHDSVRTRVLNVVTLIIAAVTSGAVGSASGWLGLGLVAPFVTWSSYVNVVQVI
jgi:tryptophan-rich sensory protein